GYLRELAGESDLSHWWSKQWSVFLAAAIVLAVGIVDDAKGVRPRLKLLGQTLAVLVLFVGGIKIEVVSILGFVLDLTHPAVTIPLGSHSLSIALPSLALTLIWFLGCMNVWNLIDGMDGLASGVGLLVSGTLMLVAIYQENFGSAVVAAALAGGLAG